MAMAIESYSWVDFFVVVASHLASMVVGATSIVLCHFYGSSQLPSVQPDDVKALSFVLMLISSVLLFYGLYKMLPRWESMTFKYDTSTAFLAW